MTPEPQQTLRFDAVAHRYTVGDEQLIGVTDAIRRAGLIDVRWFTERGRFRGQFVHLATEYDDRGELNLDDLDKVDFFEPGELLSYLEGWRMFKADYEFEPDTIEQMSFHPIHRYAGRWDRTGTGYLHTLKRRSKMLVDIKLGAHVAAYALQLAAYANLLPQPATWPRIKVKLKPGGYQVFEFPLRDLAKDFDSFLACLRVARLKQEYGIAT